MARTDREQIRRVCGWNRTLAHENARLRDELGRTKRTCLELRRANADLRVQLAASDRMLGVAMDRFLES